MTLSMIFKRAGKLVTDNSPVILTAIGVTGALTTAYLTGTATFKAADLIRERNLEELGYALQDNQWMHPKKKFELVWRLYIPAAGTAILTVAAIICANRIGNRRAAALATAYSITEKAFGEYREKITERFGALKEQGARDDLAKDRMTNNPLGTREVIITSGGDVLCYEAFTGRYFKSDVERLRRAENQINHQVVNSYYASLSDFYNLIGLPPTSYSDEVGWNSDKLLELQFSTILSDDGRPCISVDFTVKPVRDYSRIN